VSGEELLVLCARPSDGLLHGPWRHGLRRRRADEGLVHRGLAATLLGLAGHGLGFGLEASEAVLLLDLGSSSSSTFQEGCFFLLGLQRFLFGEEPAGLLGAACSVGRAGLFGEAGLFG
jgi:hypothetical protein